MKATMRAELAIALLAALAPAPVLANTARGVIHKVTDKGETYEDLAEHYYGKRYLAHHIRLFNRRAEPLPKGATLLIPTYTLVAVKPRQTLAGFAEVNLSDPSRADYLAELHDLRGRERTLPKPGTRLKVVQSLKHLVRPGESLKTIARLYYRDAGAERTKLIVLYNGLANGNVKPGMSIRIPLDGAEFNHALVGARAKRPFERAVVQLAEKTEAKPPVKKKPKPASEEGAKHAADDNDDVEALDRLCSDGDYAACETEAKRVFDASPAAPTATRVEVLRLRAVALVALGRSEESKGVFRTLLQLDPEYDLDLYRTSPKILDVFQAVAER
jgi:hypothetical protein